MIVFGRSDTALIAIICGAFLGYCTTVGTSSMTGWAQVAIGVAAGLAVAGLTVWLRRRMPHDVPLVWIDDAEKQRLLDQPPAADRSLLCVVVRPSWGSRYRLEVFVDDTRLGQLRPGTAFLAPIRPGVHELCVFYGTRRNAVRESFNAIAGERSGFLVRSYVGHMVILEIVRRAYGLETQGIGEARLLRPLVAG